MTATATPKQPMTRAWLLPAGLLLTVLATVFVPRAIAGETPRLRTEVAVAGSTVTLGDLLTDAGVHGDRPVFLAPQPGASGFISTSRVLEVARAAGIEPATPGAPGRIKVTRTGRAIGEPEVVARIREELAQQQPTLDAGQIDVKLQGTLPVTYVDPAAPALAAPKLDWSQRTGAFRAEFALPGGAKLAVAGTAQTMRMVVVTRTDLQAGAIIEADQLETKQLAANALAGETVLDAAQAVGKAAKRRLKAGAPLQESDLAAPLLVKRNQIVSIVLDLPGLALRAEGKALADAALGEGVKVMNTQSKRIVNATAIAPGTVSAGPAVPPKPGS